MRFAADVRWILRACYYDRVNREDLEELYRTHSHAEYEHQLQQILARVRDIVETLPLNAQVKGRVKSFAEYHRKWQSLGSPIGDMLGTRIICPFLDDVQLVEQTLLERLNIAEVDRKAEHHSFREFGYDSTHLVLDLNRETIPHALPGVAPVCEIQIRTILQDAWAEVEHELIYKSDWSIPTDQIRRKLAALNANLSLGDLIFQELRELQKDVQFKQERRREIQAAQTRIAPAIESQAIRARLNESADEPHRLDLNKLLLDALNAHADGAFAAAIHTYTIVLARPDSEVIRAVIHNHRGMAYFALSEHHAARADFEVAVMLDPASERAWHNLGLACRMLGDLERALAALERATALDASLTDAHAARIRCLLDAGDVSAAREAFAKLTPMQAAQAEIAELREHLGKETNPR